MQLWTPFLPTCQNAKPILMPPLYHGKGNDEPLRPIVLPVCEVDNLSPINVGKLLIKSSTFFFISFSTVGSDEVEVTFASKLARPASIPKK